MRTGFCSADAATRIARALTFLREQPAGREVYVVGSNRPAVDELCRRDAMERGSTFGLQRRTLHGLAADLAAPELGRNEWVTAPRLAQLALARQVTTRALEEGRIPILATRPLGESSAAESPSFATALLASFEELRMANIPLEGHWLGGPASEVMLLAGDLHRELCRRKLADKAAVYRAATAQLSRAARPATPTLLLDLDLADSVSADLVLALIADQPCVLTLPIGDERSRARAVGLGFTFEPDLGWPPGATGPRALDHAKREVFSPQARSNAALADDSALCFSAAGEALECAEVCRELLAAAKTGTPFDRMAIVLRSHGAYAAEMEAALQRAGIPADFERQIARPAPDGRAFLALLCCRLERGSGRRLGEYLSLGQVPRQAHADPTDYVAPRDEALGRLASEALPEQEEVADLSPVPLRQWERILGETGALAGQGGQAGVAEHVRRRLQAAQKQLALRDLEEDVDTALAEDRARRAAWLADMDARLMPILCSLDEVPLRGAESQVLEKLAALAARALMRPNRVLALLAELLPYASLREVNLHDVYETLAPHLRLAEQSAKADPRGKVVVTTPDAMRGRVRDVVSIVGLSERLFPEHRSEDPLLLDEVRARLSPELATDQQRAEAERLLLRIAIGAAEKRATFSYASFDGLAGRSRVPSLYMLELAALVSGSDWASQSLAAAAQTPSGARLVWPAPQDPQRALDTGEQMLSFIRELRALGTAGHGRANGLLARNPHVGPALRTRFARLGSALNHADGYLAASDGVGAAALAPYRLTARAYSPSALQQYAACPYQFFLRNIARVAPRHRPPSGAELDPLTRGTLYHACQATLGRGMVTRGLLANRAEDAEAIRALAGEAVIEHGSALKRELDPLLESVFDREVESILRDLLSDVALRAAEPDGFEPIASELGFGVTGPELDPASSGEPVRVLEGYLLRGVVDRVERNAAGLLRVTDYKTGRAPDNMAALVVGGGRVLQPVLYALAIESLRERGVAPDAQVSDSRLYFATERGEFRVVSVAMDQDAKQRAQTALATIDHAIERGALLALPGTETCKRCDYRVVCGPNAERRAARKRPDPRSQAKLLPIIKELDELRRLP